MANDLLVTLDLLQLFTGGGFPLLGGTVEHLHLLFATQGASLWIDMVSSDATHNISNTTSKYGTSLPLRPHDSALHPHDSRSPR